MRLTVMSYSSKKSSISVYIFQQKITCIPLAPAANDGEDNCIRHEEV